MRSEILIVGCMKDEGPFLLEWIAYYLSIGATGFLIVTNDCSDGTDEMLDELERMRIVRHLPNPSMIERFERPVQHVALRYAALQREFREAEWVLIVDADEFLNIRVGDGRFQDIFDRFAPFDAISFNQTVFGSGGQIEETTAITPLRFNWRFDFENRPPLNHPMMFGLKSLVNVGSGLFSRVSNHVPRLMAKPPRVPVWLDGSGRRMHPQFFVRRPRSYPVYLSRDPGTGHKECRVFPVAGGTHSVGYINHYAVRSLQAFVVQSMRGDAVSARIVRDAGYWRSYDRNEVEDRTIHPAALRAHPGLDRLLANERLRSLHDRAVAIHRKRFQRALRSAEVRGLIDSCRAITRERSHPSSGDGA